MTLSDFLLARIAEDEDAARDAYYDGQRWLSEEEAVVAADKDLDPVLYLDRKCDAYHAQNWSPGRVLAECEAKRRIVEGANGPERHEHDPYEWDYAFEYVLPLLALPYADHPDYRDEWAV